jgi:hypothetical protein
VCEHRKEGPDVFHRSLDRAGAFMKDLAMEFVSDKIQVGDIQARRDEMMAEQGIKKKGKQKKAKASNESPSQNG